MSVELTDDNIARLLKARQLIDDCRVAKINAHTEDGINQRELTHIIRERDMGLKILDFKGPEEVAVFNEDMCLQILRQYRTIEGECDGCKGYDGVPPCKLHFGDKSCATQGATPIDKESMYRSMLDGIRYFNKLAGIKTTKESEDKIKENLSEVNKKLVGTITKGEKEYSISTPEMLEKTRNAEKTGKYYGFCPEGHGYYNVYEKKLGDILDILWEI
jgi:hypothetical protein